MMDHFDLIPGKLFPDRYWHLDNICFGYSQLHFLSNHWIMKKETISNAY